MLQATKAFPKTDVNYLVFEKEYKNQLYKYKIFQKKLAINSDYAKKFLQIVNITQGIGTELLDTEEKRAKNISKYLSQEIDWNILYTSGHWAVVLSSWISIHTQVIKSPQEFIKDFQIIENKIQDPKQYADFARIIARSLSQQGKDDYINAIAPFIIASQKIKDYQGPLNMYIKGTIGSQGADLSFTKNQNSINTESITLKSSELAGTMYDKTLVVFYKSDCGHCENILKQLITNFDNLKEKKIQIISISKDQQKTIFKERIKDFLWKDSYWDTRY